MNNKNGSKKQLVKASPIITASTMSNLVGMWALIFDKKNPDELRYKVFIEGKADEKYFIVRCINAWTGEPNIAFLVTIEQMLDWVIIPDLGTMSFFYDIYDKKEVNPYLEFKKLIHQEDDELYRLEYSEKQKSFHIELSDKLRDNIGKDWVIIETHISLEKATEFTAKFDRNEFGKTSNSLLDVIKAWQEFYNK